MAVAPRTRWTAGDGVLPALAAAFVALELATVTRYGYFRDELYYLASTRHLDWGYVEHPPLSIAVLAAWTAAFGDSLPALRLLPALAGAALVILTGLLARRLGGGLWAQGMAGLAVLAAPEYLGGNHIYSMNAFDRLLWALAAYLWVGALEGGGVRRWAWLGVVLGLGLLNKLSMLWLGAGLLVGLLAVPQRRRLLTRGPWLAAGVAALLFLPHLLWQVQHGWPVREFVHNATTYKNVAVRPGDFLLQQILFMNPASFPIWLAGLAYCLLTRAGARWRSLAVAYLTALAILLVQGTAKAGYLAPAYPMLLAPGAVALESWLAPRRLRRLRPVLAGAVLALGALLAPFALPLLSPEGLARYGRATGLRLPQQERLDQAELPQHYADMFGWPEMVETVERVYRSLPPREQSRCVVFGQNYGEAGAIDVLGRRRGLPRAVSGHNSYWLWGPGDWTGEVMIVLGSNAEDNGAFFESVEQVATVRCRYCMPYERDLPVFVCRRFRRPVAEAWPRVKMYI